MKHETLASYYALDAGAADRDYQQPERQDDLAAMQQKVADLLEGHQVLELACGTGYWTRVIAETALSVHATDINDVVLRADMPDNVTFARTDAFDLPAAEGEYTAVFAGGWWSHVKREEQERFVAQLRLKLGKDILLVLLDEAYVDGSSTVIARTDAEGNTYHFRTLPSGERLEIMRNYPTDSYIRKKLGSLAKEIRLHRLSHYWLLKCRLK